MMRFYLFNTFDYDGGLAHIWVILYVMILFLLSGFADIVKVISC